MFLYRNAYILHAWLFTSHGTEDGYILSCFATTSQEILLIGSFSPFNKVLYMQWKDIFRLEKIHVPPNLCSRKVKTPEYLFQKHMQGRKDLFELPNSPGIRSSGRCFAKRFSNFVSYRRWAEQIINLKQPVFSWVGCSLPQNLLPLFNYPPYFWWSAYTQNYSWTSFPGRCTINKLGSFAVIQNFYDLLLFAKNIGIITFSVPEICVNGTHNTLQQHQQSPFSRLFGCQGRRFVMYAK